MRRGALHIVLIAWLICCLGAVLGGGAPDLPIYVEVFVRAASAQARDEKVAGDLTRYDDSTLTIKSARGAEQQLKWLDLTPSSAFVVKSRLIDKTDAKAWLELGRFGWSVNAKDQARAALASAVRLNPALKPDALAILANPAGSALASVPKPGTPTTRESGDVAAGPASTAPAQASAETAARDQELAPAQSAKRLGKEKLQKYQKSTPELDALAVSAAQKLSAEVSEKLKINFVEMQTDHFILFTDWDKREFGFLKDNLEGAYTLVSRQFEIPVKENIFVGKLPVFMFAKQSDFKTFALEVDGLPASDTIAGYFATLGETGVGHMAMWKPDVAKSGGDRAAAEQRWAYVLTHEFTHAFVARYRSNERVPRWLNEGVAELIANSKFPRPTARSWARTMAVSNNDFMQLFDDDKMASGEMYPVMMTMAETLLARDRKAFLAFFDDLKSGEDPEAAMKKRFKLDHAGLITAWKKHVMSK